MVSNTDREWTQYDNQYGPALGEGDTGRVYGVNAQIAVKICSNTSHRNRIAFAREARIHQYATKQVIRRRALPFIVEFLSFNRATDELRMRRLTSPWENVEDWITNNMLATGTKMTSADLFQIMGDLLQLLAFLTDIGVAHQDISNTNLWCQRNPLTQTIEFILTDFGTSKQAGDNRRSWNTWRPERDLACTVYTIQAFAHGDPNLEDHAVPQHYHARLIGFVDAMKNRALAIADPTDNNSGLAREEHTAHSLLVRFNTNCNADARGTFQLPGRVMTRAQTRRLKSRVPDVWDARYSYVKKVRIPKI